MQNKFNSLGPFACSTLVLRSLQTFSLIYRVALLAKKVLKSSQTAFMSRRNILDSVAVLHETIHEMKRKKRSGFILKLDLEKAYGKVRWPFLQQAFRLKGFSATWCRRIDQIKSPPKVA